MTQLRDVYMIISFSKPAQLVILFGLVFISTNLFKISRQEVFFANQIFFGNDDVTASTKAL